MKKIISLLSAIIVMATCLTACGSSSSSSNAASVATAAEVTAAADVTTGAVEETNAAAEAPEAATETTAAAAASATGEPVELVVFAAASMTETLTEIGSMYTALYPNITLTFNFDSSGTLKTQIQEGSGCDLFISAGQKQMNELDITADAAVNTEGLDFVLPGTRINLLENEVVLIVPEVNPADIQSFDDMAIALEGGCILMAMGNSDVPVGQYTQKILAYYELDEAALSSSGVLSYGTNVKEITSQVSEGTVDCGIVYYTDAFSAGLTPVDAATKDMCGQAIYPAALMNTSAHTEEARAFLDFLQTSEAMAIFENAGFHAAS